MSGSTDILSAVYIRTSHMKKHSSNLLQEFTTMSKITHMKKIIEDQYVFRRYFMVRQEINDELQTCIYFIKYELKISNKNNISCKKGKEKPFWLHGDGLKLFSQ